VFEVIDRDGLARLGLLETRHGVVQTPTLMPVVNPNKILIPPADMAEKFGAEIVITNAYILYQTAKKEGKSFEDLTVHDVLEYEGPIMTDSGAFQQHVYGDVEVTNREIVEFQALLGSDLATMLDVFSEPEHSRPRAAADVDETLRRAAEAVQVKEEMSSVEAGFALVGAVQGGLHPEERTRCAQELSKLDVDVAAIGGVVPLMEQYRFRDLVRVIAASKQGLSPALPVHLFGAGHPMTFALAVLLGCDLFDSASYAKYARAGRMMFIDGTRHVSELAYVNCECPVCTDHDLAELKGDEKAIAEHNLFVSFAEIGRVQQAIRAGELWELVERRCRAHPALLDGLKEIRRYAQSIGAACIMTADTHERASDRAAEAMLKIEMDAGRKTDVVVMIQGDEPMITPEMMDLAIAPLAADPSLQVTNLMAEMQTVEEFEDPNEVKVVVDLKGNALYFSREPIPSRKKGAKQVPMLKQVCIIPFRRDYLLKFNSLPPTPLEIIESVDMMRILEHGDRVRMVMTEARTLSVDTPADLARVVEMMQGDALMPKYAGTAA